ncbi:hypothetical protein ACFJGV_15175 [Cnuibacter sp. UC19_7]|uniref:phage tail protein n=1 Tax=Cnuibacter sp. UC19_7 TaxID=3350166 RepID=UPI0036724F37
MVGVKRVFVKVVPDLTGFKADASKRLKQIQAGLQVAVKLVIDGDQLARDTNRAREEAQQTAGRKPIKLAVEADTEKANHDLEEVSGTRNATVNADADTGKAEVKLDVTARNRRVNIDVALDSLSLAKVRGQLLGLTGIRPVVESLDKLNSVFQNLDRAVPKIAAVALAVGSLGSLALTSVGGLVGVIGAISSLVALAAPLPGLLAAAGVAAVVMGVAFAAAGTKLESLKPVWESLKSTIQDNFWEQAQQPILDLVNDIFPQLQDGLGQVANSLGGWAASVASSFQTAFGGGVLVGMMSKLAEAINNSTVGTDAFAQSIATLGTFASQYLPGIGTWFSEISVRFNNWLQMVANSGQLAAWVDTAMTVLTQLGSVITSVVSIFNGFISAAEAAGGGGLATLATGLGRIADVVNGPAFQKGLTQIFAGAAAGADGLAAALGPIGDMFTNLAPVIAGSLELIGSTVGELLGTIATALADPTVSDGLKLMVQGIADGISALQPAIEPLAGVLATVMPLIGTLASTLGSVLSDALVAVAPLITTLVDAIQPLIPIIGEALSSALQSIIPAFVQVAQDVLPSLIEAITTVVPLIPELAQFLGDLLVQVAPLAAQFLQTFLPALIQLIPAIIAILDAIIPLIPILTAMGAGAQILAGILSTVLVVSFNAIQAAVALVTAIVTGNWSQFTSKIMDLTKSLGSGLSDIWNGVVTFMNSIFGGLINTLAGIFRNIVLTISGFATDAFNAGKSIVEGIANGIRSAINIVKDAIGGVMNAIANFLPHSPAKEGAFSGKGWSFFSGQSISDDTARGIQSRLAGVRVAASSLADAASFTPDGFYSIDGLTRNLLTVTGGGGGDGVIGAGNSFDITVNEVSDPIGTSMAIANRIQALAV